MVCVLQTVASNEIMPNNTESTGPGANHDVNVNVNVNIDGVRTPTSNDGTIQISNYDVIRTMRLQHIETRLDMLNSSLIHHHVKYRQLQEIIQNMNVSNRTRYQHDDDEDEDDNGEETSTVSTNSDTSCKYFTF